MHDVSSIFSAKNWVLERVRSSARIVKFLTLLLLPACSFLPTPLSTCKSRAFLMTPLDHYIFSLGEQGGSIRLAIIPFTIPANFSSFSPTSPDIGRQLAWTMHQELLASESIPIVEVLNRQDWPGKREEFFTGNHGAIAQAHAAGYDLVLVGYLEELISFTEATLAIKVIDTARAKTLSYLRVHRTIPSQRPKEMPSVLQSLVDPSRTTSPHLYADLARCAADALMNPDEGGVDEEPQRLFGIF